MGGRIVIPIKIVAGVEKVCLSETKRHVTSERLLESLKLFIDNDLACLAPDLYEYYNNIYDRRSDRISGLSADTLERAINRKKPKGIVEKNSSKLLNLLCWYGFKSNWESTLVSLNITLEDVENREPEKEVIQFQAEAESDLKPIEDSKSIITVVVSKEPNSKPVETDLSNNATVENEGEEKEALSEKDLETRKKKKRLEEIKIRLAEIKQEKEERKKNVLAQVETNNAIILGLQAKLDMINKAKERGLMKGNPGQKNETISNAKTKLTIAVNYLVEKIMYFEAIIELMLERKRENDSNPNEKRKKIAESNIEADLQKYTHLLEEVTKCLDKITKNEFEGIDFFQVKEEIKKENKDRKLAFPKDILFDLSSEDIGSYLHQKNKTQEWVKVEDTNESVVFSNSGGKIIFDFQKKKITKIPTGLMFRSFIDFEVTIQKVKEAIKRGENALSLGLPKSQYGRRRHIFVKFSLKQIKETKHKLEFQFGNEIQEYKIFSLIVYNTFSREQIVELFFDYILLMARVFDVNIDWIYLWANCFHRETPLVLDFDIGLWDS